LWVRARTQYWATSPKEIAVSIMSQISGSKRDGSEASLKDKDLTFSLT
jgi:xanthine/CO dehydrogenase XdhC/CoxF family maturation factor